MKKGFLTILTIFYLFIFFSHDLQAQMGKRSMMGKGHMEGMKGKMGQEMCFGDKKHMRETLKLTDNQITSISKINHKYIDKLAVYRDKLEPNKILLKKLLLNSININIVKIRNLLKKISNIEIEIRLIKILQRSEIENVFSARQRARLINERMPHRGSRARQGTLPELE